MKTIFRQKLFLCLTLSFAIQVFGADVAATTRMERCQNWLASLLPNWISARNPITSPTKLQSRAKNLPRNTVELYSVGDSGKWERLRLLIKNDNNEAAYVFDISPAGQDGNLWNEVKENSSGRLSFRQKLGALLKFRIRIEGQRFELLPDRHDNLLETLLEALDQDGKTSRIDDIRTYLTSSRRTEPEKVYIRPRVLPWARFAVLLFGAGAYPWNSHGLSYQSDWAGRRLGISLEPFTAVPDRWAREYANLAQYRSDVFILAKGLRVAMNDGDFTVDPELAAFYPWSNYPRFSLLNNTVSGFKPVKPLHPSLYEKRQVNQIADELFESLADKNKLRSFFQALEQEDVYWKEGSYWVSTYQTADRKSHQLPDLRIPNRVLAPLVPSLETKLVHDDRPQVPLEYVKKILYLAEMRSNDSDFISQLRRLTDKNLKTHITKTDGSTQIHEEQGPKSNRALYAFDPDPFGWSLELGVSISQSPTGYIDKLGFYNESELLYFIESNENGIPLSAAETLAKFPNLSTDARKRIVRILESKLKFLMHDSESASQWWYLTNGPNFTFEVSSIAELASSRDWNEAEPLVRSMLEIILKEYERYKPIARKNNLVISPYAISDLAKTLASFHRDESLPTLARVIQSGQLGIVHNDESFHSIPLRGIKLLEGKERASLPILAQLLTQTPEVSQTLVETMEDIINQDPEAALLLNDVERRVLSEALRKKGKELPPLKTSR